MTIDITKLKAEAAAKAAAQQQNSTETSAITNKPAEEEQPNQPKQAETQIAEKIKSLVRIFYGEFPDHHNYLTPKGKVVGFYRGYCVTADEEVIEYIKTLREVKDVTDELTIDQIPTPPKRDRNRNWASAQGAQPGLMSPADLLSIAVANSSTTIQAPQSNSSK